MDHYPHRREIIVDTAQDKHPHVALTDETQSRAGWWLGFLATSVDRRIDGAIRTPSVLGDLSASYVQFPTIRKLEAPTPKPAHLVDEGTYALMVHPLGWLFGLHSERPASLKLPTSRFRDLHGFPWFKQGTLVTSNPGTPDEDSAIVLSVDYFNERCRMPTFLGCMAYPTASSGLDTANPNFAAILKSLGAVEFQDTVDGDTWYAFPTHVRTYAIDLVATRCPKCQRAVSRYSRSAPFRKRLNLVVRDGCLDCDGGSDWPFATSSVSGDVLTDIVRTTVAAIAPGSKLFDTY